MYASISKGVTDTSEAVPEFSESLLICLHFHYFYGLQKAINILSDIVYHLPLIIWQIQKLTIVKPEKDNFFTFYLF